MPMPLSVISICSVILPFSWLSARALKYISPCSGVYLTAISCSCFNDLSYSANVEQLRKGAENIMRDDKQQERQPKRAHDTDLS